MSERVSEPEAPRWSPSPERAAATQLAAFTRFVGARGVADVDDYAALHSWSVREPADFWSAVWDFAGVPGSRVYVALQTGELRYRSWCFRKR